MATAKPSVSGQIQPAASHNREDSLSMWVSCRGFGNFPCRVLFSMCSDLPLLLFRLPRFDHLVSVQCTLHLPVQPVSVRFLQSISTYSRYFFLVFCIICGYLINFVLLFYQADITLLKMIWDGHNGIT